MQTCCVSLVPGSRAGHSCACPGTVLIPGGLELAYQGPGAGSRQSCEQSPQVTSLHCSLLSLVMQDTQQSEGLGSMQKCGSESPKKATCTVSERGSIQGYCLQVLALNSIFIPRCISELLSYVLVWSL